MPHIVGACGRITMYPQIPPAPCFVAKWCFKKNHGLVPQESPHYEPHKKLNLCYSYRKFMLFRPFCCRRQTLVLYIHVSDHVILLVHLDSHLKFRNYFNYLWRKLHMALEPLLSLVSFFRVERFNHYILPLFTAILHMELLHG